jgi:uncharacterized protein
MKSILESCCVIALAIGLLGFNATSSRADVITACERGDQADCEDMDWRASNLGKFRECHAGNVAVCEDIASRYDAGRYENAIQWKAFSEMACEHKSARACNNLGVVWSTGKKPPLRVSLSLGNSYYKKACDLSHGLGCFNFANMYRLGEGVPVDMKLAMENYSKACDLDEAKGCTELGIMYYEGQVVEKNILMSFSLFRKACKLGSAVACKNADMVFPRVQ